MLSGVRGLRGLGCAEEQGCIADIDFLVGTFGKALASSGAYIVCSQVIREYLINKMRPFIFTDCPAPHQYRMDAFLTEETTRMGYASPTVVTDKRSAARSLETERICLPINEPHHPADCREQAAAQSLWQMYFSARDFTCYRLGHLPCPKVHHAYASRSLPPLKRAK